MCVYNIVLHTAGRHMEDSIMAAYIALLIGTLIQHKQVICTAGCLQSVVYVYASLTSSDHLQHTTLPQMSSVYIHS